MQQIDWSKAPEWAIGHVYQPWGYGYWVEAEPELGKFIHNWGRWWFPQGAKAEASNYTLELGSDYRTSLEFRPSNANTRPAIVVLCGSTRFSKEYQEANLLETLQGKIVLTIGCDMRSDHELFDSMSKSELQELKSMLDDLHLRKIDLADEVLILNKDGYIGQSTAREIEYALALGKPIRYLESYT